MEQPRVANGATALDHMLPWATIENFSNVSFVISCDVLAAMLLCLY
jgi:hypothetical protein